MAKSPAWQRKEGKNPNGGLNAKGRASAKKQGMNLKPPQPEGGKRRDSFCARMKGMKAKLTSAKTAKDPNSRINKSLRAWNCWNGSEPVEHCALFDICSDPFLGQDINRRAKAYSNLKIQFVLTLVDVSSKKLKIPLATKLKMTTPTHVGQWLVVRATSIPLSRLKMVLPVVVADLNSEASANILHRLNKYIIRRKMYGTYSYSTKSH